MELHNVPKNVQLNTPLDSAMKGRFGYGDLRGRSNEGGTGI